MAQFNIREAFTRMKQSLDYTNIFFFIGLHLGAVAAFFFFSWKALAVFLAFHAVSGMGITLGYHRLLTHRSFAVPKWLERCIATAGVLAFQRGPITWVAEHRLHHSESDTELDPHNINDGFFWAHMGWVLYTYPEWYMNGIREAYAPDLQKDAYYRWLDRNASLVPLAVGVALLAVGGWGFFLWGFCLRTVCMYHSTWLVNSAAHKWGYRTANRNEAATNNWWVALLSYGEGWHNNHHAYPTSARHGLRGWEFDPSWMVIWTMKKLGLASKVRLPQKAELPWHQQQTG